jgi:hypothetical protein
MGAHNIDLTESSTSRLRHLHSNKLVHLWYRNTTLFVPVLYLEQQPLLRFGGLFLLLLEPQFVEELLLLLLLRVLWVLRMSFVVEQLPPQVLLDGGHIRIRRSNFHHQALPFVL